MRDQQKAVDNLNIPYGNVTYWKSVCLQMICHDSLIETGDFHRYVKFPEGTYLSYPSFPIGLFFFERMAEVQVARVQTPSAAPTPSSGYPTPTAYRTPQHTPQPRNQMFSPYGQAGYSPVAPSPFNVR